MLMSLKRCRLFIVSMVPLFPFCQTVVWYHFFEHLQAFAERVMKSEQASKEPFKSSIENFYQTDSITRSSSVMAKCVQARKNMHIDTLSTAEMSSN
jgi:hypothetical protein